MKRLAGIPVWIFAAAVAAGIGVWYVRKRGSASASSGPVRGTASSATPAFSSQQELQDFGIFQSLTQAQQASDVQYLSTVLSLFGGNGAASSSNAGWGNGVGSGGGPGSAGGGGGSGGAQPGVNATPAPGTGGLGTPTGSSTTSQGWSGLPPTGTPINSIVASTVPGAVNVDPTSVWVPGWGSVPNPSGGPGLGGFLPPGAAITGAGVTTGSSFR